VLPADTGTRTWWLSTLRCRAVAEIVAPAALASLTDSTRNPQ
jgi:hypothetical protein